ncbi:MAG: right-handed parallel beta-helix repeat-containing protein, partial [Bacteroidota bacterium]
MKIIKTLCLIVLCTSSLLASRFYLDPNQGDLANSGTMISPWPSLEEVIDAGYIMSQRYSPLPYNSETSDLIIRNPDGIVGAGDTLILMDGLHGSVFLLGYINQMPITVMGMDGHSPVVEYIHLRACKNWRFENIEVSSEPYGYYLNGRLCFVESHSWHGPSSHVEILGCEMYSAAEPWETAEEWSEKVSSGLYIIGDSVTVLNNVLRNIGFGITATGDYIVASRNRIVNFSGDGMRLLGSHQVFSYNLIKNCYDINENHDDGIQSWAQINGIVADDNQLIGNIIINTDDTERPLNGPLQGIGCFDGFYNRWRVENNLVLVDHWHGITFLGANDCQIVNNTVIDLTPDMTPGASWIRVADHKNGTASAGCLVANNVANSFHVDANTSNNVIL